MKSLQSYVQTVKQGREPVSDFKEQGDCSGHGERQSNSLQVLQIRELESI